MQNSITPSEPGPKPLSLLAAPSLHPGNIAGMVLTVLNRITWIIRTIPA
jgi:hypothetical protein